MNGPRSTACWPHSKSFLQCAVTTTTGPCSWSGKNLSLVVRTTQSQSQWEWQSTETIQEGQVVLSVVGMCQYLILLILDCLPIFLKGFSEKPRKWGVSYSADPRLPAKSASSVIDADYRRWPNFTSLGYEGAHARERVPYMRSPKCGTLGMLSAYHVAPGCQ